MRPNPIYIYYIVFSFFLLNVVSCKKKEANPEAPVNKLLDDESKCRISSYKWDVGTESDPFSGSCLYDLNNLVNFSVKYNTISGTIVENKSLVIYNNYGNPDNVANLVFFKYDKDNLVESMTRYSKGNVLQNGYRIDTVKEYKAYLKWEKGNIASITECFFRIKDVGSDNYEFEELPPWSYTNFIYDIRGDIINAEKLDNSRRLRYNIVYEYDENPNPLRSLFILRGDYRFQQHLLSKNNCTKLSIKMEDGTISSELKFSYKYDENNYPTNGFLGDGQFFDIKYECR